MKSSDKYKQIAELCTLMHEETVFGQLEYNPEKLAEFSTIMDRYDDAILITHGSPVIAVFIGEVYPHVYTDDLIAVDQLMYVHPEHRRSGLASKMVKQYKEWAEIVTGKHLTNEYRYDW